MILNDYDSIRDALRKDSFLGRPDCSSFSLLTGVKSLFMKAQEKQLNSFVSFPGLIDDAHSSWREERRVFEAIYTSCFESTAIYRNLIGELKSLLVQLKKSDNSPLSPRKTYSSYIDKFFYSFVFGRHVASAKSLFDSSLFINISILSLWSGRLGKLFYKLFDIFNHYRFSLFVKFFR